MTKEFLLALTGALFISNASAQANVPHSGSINQIVRSPGPVIGVDERSVFAGSRSSNPGRVTVKAGNGLGVTSSVSVDEPHAQLHAYLDFFQPNSSVAGTILQSIGSLGAYSEFRGASNGASGAVPVTFQMSFHGSISPAQGTAASLSLSGGVSVSIANDLFGSPVETDTAVLSFSDIAGQLQILHTTDQQLGNGAVDHGFAGAQWNVNSQNLANLDGTVTVTTLVRPGQFVIVQNGLSALAVLAAAPSAGTVDASNTANIKIFTPTGYSFDTASDSLFRYAVVAVPEPQTFQLLACGLAALLFYRRANSRRK